MSQTPTPAELLDLLPAAAARVGPDLRLAWVNARFAAAHRVPAAELVGRTCLELGATAAAWGDWVGAVRAVFATGRPADTQFVSHLPDGDRHVLTKCGPVFGPDGGVAEVLAVAVENAEVGQLRAALSASEATLRAFLDHLPATAWLRDADERYLFVNRQYRQRAGVTDADRVGRHVREVYPPGVADALLANDARALAEGPVRTEEQVPDPAGVPRPWLNVKFVVPGADGRPRYAGIGLDLSAERAAEAQRRELAARVEAAHRAEALGVLAGGVAHDFNNILCAVMGFAGLGRELARDGPPALRDCLAQIETAAERAAEVCRQMLAYAGRGRVEVRPVDLPGVVRETVRLLAAGHLRGVTVHDRMPAGLPPAAGDPTQLRRVALNLLANAAEATAGRPERVVTLVADVAGPPAGLPPGRYVRLAVADTGTGMDPATQARVFEPFFTTKFAGRGLGLAAVNGIVRGHGGAVSVESAPGAGSTFTVSLPVNPGRRPE